MNHIPQPCFYIGGIGAITAVGGDSPMNYFAVRAQVSGYKSYDYFTRERERVTMALVPDEALPPLQDELDVRGKLSFRDGRILRMCHVAAAQAMQGFAGKRPIPLLFAGPANDFLLPASFSSRFIRYLIAQSGLPIDVGASRLIATGRTGVLDALAFAMRYLYESDFDEILIGGGDSHQNSDLLAALDKDERLLAPGVKNGFAPGEGAGFVRLTRNPAAALRTHTHIPCLLTPGIAREPGHLFSSEPFRGDGLAQAFAQALAHAGGDAIGAIYSSMNGEHYWAKEYGVALIRNQEHFTQSCVHHHPADCYGDLGAATGALLISHAAHAVLNGKTSAASLIYCSADQAYRAAACLVPLPWAQVQQSGAPAPVPFPQRSSAQ